MKKVLQLLAFSALSFFIACGDKEDPAPPHEVGSWDLINFAFTNVPEAFARFDDITFELNELSSISSYVLKLDKGGEYSRTVKEDGKLPSTDKGTWKIDTDSFTLSPEGENDEEFSLFKNEEDQFWFGDEVTFSLIPDTTLTRLVGDYGNPGYLTYLDTVNQTTYESLFKLATLDLIFVFEREE